MSLKTKFLSAIVALCFVVALLGVGVWAANRAQVNIGGTVSFTATDIVATITGVVDGTASDPKLETLVYTAAKSPTDDEIATWSKDLNFKKEGTPFTITITIQNQSSRSIFLSVTDEANANASLTKTITQDGETYQSGTEYELKGNQSVVYIITISISSTANTVTGSYAYLIDLKDVSETENSGGGNSGSGNTDVADVGTYETLDFFTNSDGTNTVSVMADSTNKPTGALVIPEKVSSGGTVYTVTKIDYTASTTLQEVSVEPRVVLPPSAGGAFENCTGLTSITIPNSVTSIGASAFSGCSGLVSAILGNGVISIGSGAFSGCSNLANITIPDSVEFIVSNAFFGCSGLTIVTIGSGVTSIGDGAFVNCSELKTVTMKGSTPPTLGGDVFPIALKAIYVPSTAVSTYQGTSGWSNYASLIMTEGTALDETAYPKLRFEVTDSTNHYVSVEAVNTSIEGAVDIPEKVKISNIDYTVTSFGICDDFFEPGSEGAFLGCDSITSVIIPKTISEISIKAFYSCMDLKSVVIENGVTSIGNYAFSRCNSLTSVSISDSVEEIGQSAFSGCISLTSITIPDSVTSIGDYVFSACTSLTSIKIGNGVTSIGQYAFNGCDNLANVYYRGSQAQWEAISIGSSNAPLINSTKHYNYTGA